MRAPPNRDVPNKFIAGSEISPTLRRRLRPRQDRLAHLLLAQPCLHVREAYEVIATATSAIDGEVNKFSKNK